MTEFVRLGCRYSYGRLMISGDENTRDSLPISSVDLVVRVHERALGGEDRGVSNLFPRSVITTSVTVLGLGVRSGQVLLDQSLVELCQLAIGVVCLPLEYPS